MTGILAAQAQQRIAWPGEDHAPIDAPPWCE